jgi:hypothetical protein
MTSVVMMYLLTISSALHLLLCHDFKIHGYVGM